MIAFICKDDDGDWYFDSDSERYVRIKGTEVRGRISGKQLPDPHLLFKSYRKIHPESRPPTEATYKLWEHWNALQQKPS